MKKYGESRGEGHKSGERFKYDPADKKAFQALNQKTKDSLHGEANKYGKPFFSPKHGVNVDPEDGVLSNRPVYSDNTKLTYDKIDKPFDSPANFASQFVGKSPLAKLKSKQDSIKPITKEMKEAAKLGGAGAIGMIGGAAGGAAKGASKAVKALGKNDAKAGITISKPNPGGVKGKSKSKSNFKPFHRDGKVYDTKAVNDAFKQRFGGR